MLKYYKVHSAAGAFRPYPKDFLSKAYCFFGYLIGSHIFDVFIQ